MKISILRHKELIVIAVAIAAIVLTIPASELLQVAHAGNGGNFLRRKYERTLS